MSATHHSIRVGGRVTRFARIDKPLPYLLSASGRMIWHETGWIPLEPHYVQLCETKPGVFRVVEVHNA